MNPFIADKTHPDIANEPRKEKHRSRLVVMVACGTKTFVACTAFAILIPSVTFAQWYGGSNGNEPGILVEGSGEVRSVPDVVEINLRLSAKGELTDDAVVKHRDSKKRALETFKALKIENLELLEKNLSLKAGTNMQEMMWGGMPPAANKRTQVEIGSTLRARLTGIDKIPPEELMSNVGKLLDAAQDAGVGLGMSDADMMMMRWYGWGRQMNNSLVKFIVTNVKDQREKAYEMAVNDAKKRAERLARLSNVKLGHVLAVDEMGNNWGNRYYYGPMDMDDDEHKEEIVAETMSGGKLKITVRVRFAIEASKGDANPPATIPSAATTETAK